MQRKIITTADGSKTIQIEQWNEQYHSLHGAIQEAKHVYLKQGLFYFLEEVKDLCHPIISKPENNVKSPQISVLEIGFGTGLNAFLTLLEAERLEVAMSYVGVEAYPVLPTEISGLNYVEQLQVLDMTTVFKNMHEVPWEKEHQLTSYFTLHKQQRFFDHIDAINQFDLVYFDAFGARVQPELWTESIFRIMFNALKAKGVLVTYAAKGSVRRAMQAVGFDIEKLAGPPGKREMLRAIKP